MFWRSENEIVEQFVKLFRRILKYQSSWENVDYRIVSIANAPKIYEKFFEDAEQYPVITVSGAGFNKTQQSLNSYLGAYQGDIVSMGTRGLNLGLVNENSPLAFALPDTVENTDNLYGIELYAMNAEYITNLDDLQITLYENYQTTPVAVSSASIANICNCYEYKKYYAEFYPSTVLNGNDYWLKFTAPTDNSFYVGLDTQAENVFEYTHTGSIVRASGSVHGKLLTQPVVRLGGGIEGSVVVRCAGKNSTSIPRNILAILSNYIELFKQAQLDRQGTDLTTLTIGGDTAVDEWLLKDIRIKNIRQSTSQERRRGENDIIFSYDLTVEYYTEWHQDYAKDTLSGFDIELDSIFPDDIIGGVEEDEVFNVYNPAEV